MFRKTFSKVTFNENLKIFVVYISCLLIIYLARKAQITSLLIKKIQILDHYLNYIDVFLKAKAEIMPEITNFNQYAIEL